MKIGMTIGKEMTPAPRCVEAGARLLLAQELMRRHDIRHLPVTEKGTLCGILSERDVNLALSLAAHIIDEDKILVGDVCVRDPYLVEPDKALSTVATEMAQRRIGSVLVVKNNKLVGMFTTTDACRCLGERLEDA